ncbi:MAG: hypothetical protein AB1705_27095 [Verrucomicrobiota bacterium]
MQAQPRKARRWLIYGTVALVFAGVVFWRYRQSGVDRWMNQMRAQGEKFTFHELGITGPTPADPNEAQLDSAVAALRGNRFTPAVVDMMPFAGPGQARVIWKEPHLSYAGTNLSWANYDQQLGAAQASLQQIKSLAARPSRTRGLDYRQVLGPWPNYVTYRVAAQWMSGDVIYHLHRSDLPAAQDSLIALVRLAQMFSDESTLVSQMIRVAILGLGIADVWTALESPGWDEAHLAELQRELEAVSILDKLPRTLEMERASGLAAFEFARTNDARALRAQYTYMQLPAPTNAARDFVDDYVVTPLWRLAWQERDKLFYLQNMQVSIVAAHNAQKHQSWVQLSNELAQVEVSMGKNRMRGAPASLSSTNFFSAVDALRTQMSQLIGGRFDRAFQIAMRNLTQRNLAVAAIAVRRYQLRHGKAPGRLGELVPEFLGAVPVDYMDGQPLRYRLNADGTFVLYSAGDNGIDDGGNPAWVGQKTFPGIADGRDMVWPKAAPPPKPLALPKDVLPLVEFQSAPLAVVLEVIARQGGLAVEFDAGVRERLERRQVSVRYVNISVGGMLQNLASNHGLGLEAGSKTNSIVVRLK